MQESNESTHSVSRFFREPSDFSNLLVPTLEALGWAGSDQNLVESLPHFSDQMSLVDFRNVLANLNFRTEPIQISIDRLDERILPALFVSNDDANAILITGIEGQSVVCTNGKSGQREEIEFQRLEGTLYAISPFDEEDVKLYKKNWLSRNVSRFKLIFIQMFIISFIMNVMLLVTPVYILTVYDRVIPSKSIELLSQLCLGALLIILAVRVLFTFRTKMIAYINARMNKTVGETIIRTLMYLPINYLENDPIAAQLSRIKEFDSMREFFAESIATLLVDLPFVIVFLAVVAYLGGFLVLIPIVTIIAYAILFYIFKTYAIKISQDQHYQLQKKQNFLMEVIIEIKEIKTLGIEDIWERRYQEIASKSSIANFKASMVVNTLNAIANAMVMMTAAFTLYFGALSIINGSISLGALIAIMMLTWRGLDPIKKLFNVFPKILRVMLRFQQINTLVHLDTENTLPTYSGSPLEQKPGVEFSRVSFKYRAQLPAALLGVTFTVQPGEIVAITGANGAGKSTLLKLLAGLYHPQAGQIMINRANIQQIHPVQLRQSISYLPQEIKLFYGTVEQNILLANPSKSSEDVIEVTKKAGLYDEIMELSEGFKTRIGDQSNVQLSSSFIQKIGIARTYLNDSRLYLFDEPGSCLDHHDDELFMNMIKELSQRSTVFLVTHRPSQMKVADRVVYIKNGQLIISGKSEEVLSELSLKML